jgi:8-oxo-dGTP pyrophosphatase MutT (NUDIX family)
VGGLEELAHSAKREVLEETGIHAGTDRLAYIDELIGHTGRIAKFWFVGRYLSGIINVKANPIVDEKITEAGWFSQHDLPAGHVFLDALRSRFWTDLDLGFPAPQKLQLRTSIFCDNYSSASAQRVRICWISG